MFAPILIVKWGVFVSASRLVQAIEQPRLWSQGYWPTLRKVNAESPWLIAGELMSGEEKKKRRAD
ncbi:MAG TPA: hypothetical protein DDX04_07160 [Massilia sp.]|nr:hypothetical protein [Massilia sp.]